MKKNENYQCGIKNEKRVASKYKKIGAENVEQTAGSRGSYDLKADFKTRKTHLIQVKSTCEKTGKVKPLSKAEVNRLEKDAIAKNAIPVVATVTNKGIEMHYLRNGRKVLE